MSRHIDVPSYPHYMEVRDIDESKLMGTCGTKPIIMIERLIIHKINIAQLAYFAGPVQYGRNFVFFSSGTFYHWIFMGERCGQLLFWGQSWGDAESHVMPVISCAHQLPALTSCTSDLWKCNSDLPGKWDYNYWLPAVYMVYMRCLGKPNPRHSLKTAKMHKEKSPVFGPDFWVTHFTFSNQPHTGQWRARMPCTTALDLVGLFVMA